MRAFIALCILLIGLTVFTGGCAAGPNPSQNTQDEQGRVAGFWRGLWHGVIAPIAFIVSIFVKSVHFYEVHNNGGWYNFGFVLGSGILGGGGGWLSSRKRRRNESD